MRKMKGIDIDEIKAIQKAVAAGYGGVLPSGQIVDRREHPEALPIPHSRSLGVPKPKSVKKWRAR